MKMPDMVITLDDETRKLIELIVETQRRMIDLLTGCIKMEEKPKERYPMCKDQPAQIDCRKGQCMYWHPGGCSNISPAITLRDDGAGECWSYYPKP